MNLSYMLSISGRPLHWLLTCIALKDIHTEDSNDFMLVEE